MPFRARNRGLLRAGGGLMTTSSAYVLAGARALWDPRIRDGSQRCINQVTAFPSLLFPANMALSTMGLTSQTCFAVNTAGSNFGLSTEGFDSPMNGVTSPQWVQVIYQRAGDTVICDMSGGGERAHCYNISGSGQYTMRNGAAVNVGAIDNNAHIVTFIFNSTNSRFFKDGVKIGTTFNAGTGTVASSTRLTWANVAGFGIGAAGASKFGLMMVGTGAPSDAAVIASHTAWNANYPIY